MDVCMYVCMYVCLYVSDTSWSHVEMVRYKVAIWRLSACHSPPIEPKSGILLLWVIKSYCEEFCNFTESWIDSVIHIVYVHQKNRKVPSSHPLPPSLLAAHKHIYVCKHVHTHTSTFSHTYIHTHSHSATLKLLYPSLQIATQKLVFISQSFRDMSTRGSARHCNTL